MFDKAKFKREKVGNQVTFKYEDDSVYTSKSEIDVDTLKKVEDYRNRYAKAATTIAAELAKDTMQKEKDVDKVVLEAPFTTSAKGGIEVTVDRSKTFPGVNGKEPVTKSKITTIITDPYCKVSKKYVKDLEADLTKVLLKG